MAGEMHKCYDVEIGDRVFMGSNVRVLKGVTIGTGAVIANSAVVTRDIPANCVAAGVPAKVIRHLP
jgi:acetyltransferase-like isoleucine patch superfamily enzyme